MSTSILLACLRDEWERVSYAVFASTRLNTVQVSLELGSSAEGILPLERQMEGSGNVGERLIIPASGLEISRGPHSEYPLLPLQSMATSSSTTLCWEILLAEQVLRDKSFVPGAVVMHRRLRRF